MHAIRSYARVAVLIALWAVLPIATMAAQPGSPDVALAHGAAAAPAAAVAPAIIRPTFAFAVPAHAGSLPSAAGGLLRVALALLVVLAAIFGAGWLSRRVHGTGGTRHPGLEVLAQLPLGPRERAVLIRVGAQQLLVGVTGGCVRTLHVCAPDAVAAGVGAAGMIAAPADAGAAAAAAAAAAAVGAGAPLRPTFKSLLLKSLGK